MTCVKQMVQMKVRLCICYSFVLVYFCNMFLKVSPGLTNLRGSEKRISYFVFTSFLTSNGDGKVYVASVHIYIYI